MTDIDTKRGARTEVVDALDLGVVIRERRAQHELTQDEVAEALGVHRRYVYDLERGAPDLRLQRTLEALKLLGVNVRLDIDGKPVQLPSRRRATRKPAQTTQAPIPEGTPADSTGDDAAGERKEQRGARRRWFRR